MILEVAMLSVRAGEGKAFEAAFAEAQGITASMPGYVGHELQRCLEVADRYVLLVGWRSVEDHETQRVADVFAAIESNEDIPGT